MHNLRYILLGLAAALALVLVSCEVEGEYLPVKFHVHKACAMKNPPEKVENKVMYSEQDFNSYFTYTVAGSQSIDSVDFKTSFIVAVCAESSSQRRSVEITEVLSKDMVLYVKYRIVDHGKISYKMAPCVVASVSRDYAGYDVSFHDVTGME